MENISIERRLASMVNMPDNVKSYILEKNNEIKSGENNYKIQMAVNGLMQFPWKPINFKNEYVEIRKSICGSRNYLQNVARELDRNVYGHEKSKKTLIELVGKWIQNPDSTGQVIGLVGPPGVGKTLFAKSISMALNIPLSVVGLGGMSDSADLIGHSFTYAGAQYGMIIRQMIKAGSWRSVMFFDEIDKISKRNDVNEIQNTLIHITDKNMSKHYQDRFYSSSIEFDLSGTLIIFSYNSSEKIDPILLDRIKEIEISAYSIKEKISISQNYMLKELCLNIGFDRSKITFSDSVIEYIIINYTIESGVRELSRKLEQILLKINIDRIYLRGPFTKLIRDKITNIDKNLISDMDSDTGDDEKINIVSYVECPKNKIEQLIGSDSLHKIFNMEFDEKIDMDIKFVHRYLGKPSIFSEKTHAVNLVGVINGLYATTIGIGGITPIQIYPNNIYDSQCGTNAKLKITGNQKKIMQESVTCALNVAFRIISSEMKENVNMRYSNGFHVHAPDGGTPKDGPSAGCAFVTAFVSILLDKKINRYVAMTGEIELTGNISKIGKLDIKLNGAKKAGIKIVYVCEENREDYESIKKKNPEMFNESFRVIIVKHIIDIITDPNVILNVSDEDFDQSILSEYYEQK